MIGFLKWLFRTDERALERHLNSFFPGHSFQVRGRIRSGFDVGWRSDALSARRLERQEGLVRGVILEWLLENDYPARPKGRVREMP